MLDVNTLPNDVEDLKRLVIEHHAASAAKDIQLNEQRMLIEHLRFQIAKLRRARFGQSSEALEGVGQLAMSFEELKAAIAEAERQVAAAGEVPASEAPKGKPVRRKKLPEHFERIPHLIEPKECTCPECGGALTELGRDESEVLEVKTVTFTVTRHIRPKKRCAKCAAIVQAPAPSRPIEKSFAGASLLALILTWKYGFHLPLYRQCQIFAHAGLKLSRTTLMQWVAASSALLGPLVAGLAKHVLSAGNIHADDTPFRVLAPGTGKTRRGHMWTYVRDGTGWGSRDPPAVWYQYSPSWHGKYPQKHLAGFTGKLQVDAYAGFEPLFLPSSPGVPARVEEISCMAHARRRFFDLYAALKSPIAKEALERIGVLYQIEDHVRGSSPEVRLAARQQYAVPHLEALHAWMTETLSQIDSSSTLTEAFNYSLKRWKELCRYCEDGRLEIDNSIAERSIRGMGIGRRNYLFFGSDTGGERAAIIYSLIESCKLNHIDPQSYLQYVLERIADHPINRIEELLPWNVATKLGQPAQVTNALAA
ncbi:MAG: IS66 family transposase [Steroidobacteraceae bacterium]